MKNLKTIPPALVTLIPPMQLEVTRNYLKEYSALLIALENLLNQCPKIGETDGMKEHPVIFHYFWGSTDYYICEFDRTDLMFGYSILDGDLPNSEWGYFSLTKIKRSILMNIDYHFPKQSIEAALYLAHPRYFKKPKGQT